MIQTLSTNESGNTDTIALPAPNLSYSTQISEVQPYSEYNISVTAPGYEPVFISGTEILPDVTAVQPVSMNPLEVEPPGETEEDIVIPDHTLYGEYPPKIPEDEIKPMDESGEIVLSRVVIPEYVIVHDGLPQDSSPPTTMCGTRTISKMSCRLKSMRHGLRIASMLIRWRLCPSR